MGQSMMPILESRASEGVRVPTSNMVRGRPIDPPLKGGSGALLDCHG